MGLQHLMRYISMERQRQRRRCQIQPPLISTAADGSIASRNKRKACSQSSSLQLQQQGNDGSILSRTKIRKGSPCQQDDDCQIYSGPSLPEDIWCLIHSMLPMQDAARVACVSRAFLRSWRCHPNLTFSDTTLGLNKNVHGNDQTFTDFCSIVDPILKRHSSIGVKKLKIHMVKYCNPKDSCYLDSWLQIAVTRGIEELSLLVPNKKKYKLPYSLFSNGIGDSVRYLNLAGCFFRPSSELGLLRNLTRLHLHVVYIKDDELGHLLSNSFALERLGIVHCDKIVCLMVPCMLHRLSYLEVLCCERLQVIDNKAPNISFFNFSGDHQIQLSLGETLQMKKLIMSFPDAVHFSCVELPSLNMPNLETLDILSGIEVVDTPTLHSKYVHLKNLAINLSAARTSYDYFSLISFLDACPSLEAFTLNVVLWEMNHVSIFTDASDLRRIQLYHHKIKTVKITGFTYAKSLIELACYFVENITSLECLTLETQQSFLKCYNPGDNCSKCSSLPNHILADAQLALLAIRTYIEPKVPSTVDLHVVKPCTRCHTVEEL